MNKKNLTEEERRRRRNEASRRCYLKRKAALAEQGQPVGAKNRKQKTKPAKQAKPAKQVKIAKAKPAPKGKSPLNVAEKIVKRFAKIAAGIKPMVKEAAELLGSVYKTEDQRTIEKTERILSKGLGVGIASPTGEDQAKSRVLLQVLSKVIKTPDFRLVKAESVQIEEDPPAVDDSEGQEDGQPAEVPVDPAVLDNIEAGDETPDIALPTDDGKESGDEDDDLLEDDEDAEETEDDEDEDDEDDDSPEAEARRENRRRKAEADNEAEYESGRWEMMGEMGAQGAFDD